MSWAVELWRENALLAMSLALFLGGLGVPGPATLSLVATGALARAGGVGLLSGALCAVAAVAAGDLASYLLARRELSRWVERRQARPRWKAALRRFERNAPLTLFLSRWLLTPISLPSTYIAGSSRYPVGRYLAASTPGQVMWVAIYGGLGYAFANEWRPLYETVKRYGLWGGIALTALALGAYGLHRYRKACFCLKNPERSG